MDSIFWSVIKKNHPLCKRIDLELKNYTFYTLIVKELKKILFSSMAIIVDKSILKSEKIYQILSKTYKNKIDINKNLINFNGDYHYNSVFTQDKAESKSIVVCVDFIAINANFEIVIIKRTMKNYTHS